MSDILILIMFVVYIYFSFKASFNASIDSIKSYLSSGLDFFNISIDEKKSTEIIKDYNPNLNIEHDLLDLGIDNLLDDYSKLIL